MKLSKRLNQISKMIPSNCYVIDVGCDHGLLDIYLTLYNQNNCLATDISENSIEKTKKNIIKYGLLDKIPLKKTDGLNDITIKKNSVVIMSGLGASTIINILQKNNLNNVKNIIIQSNNDLIYLRKQVVKLGYKIIDEKTILDKNIYYVIIKFEKGKMKYSNKDYYLGPILKNDNENKDYYYNLYSKNKKILKQIPNKYFWKKICLLIKNQWLKKIYM